MREYTKPTSIDNLLISPTPNSLTELAEYQPTTRFRPGDPISQKGKVDAYEALRRNADAGAPLLKFKTRNAPTFDDPTGGLRRAA